MSKIIGIMSDTHGLVRTEAIEILKGCELIIYAGDVGKPKVIHTLEEIASVVPSEAMWIKEIGRRSFRKPKL